MKVEAGFGGRKLDTIADEARRLESLGYDGIVTGETMYEITTRWTLACAATERVDVGTSVMIAFPRSPFVVAQQAWELQEFSKGRVNLGLGTQVKGHNERRFSSGQWAPPAPRMQEYVQMVRAVWNTFQTGARPEFAGQYYQFRLCPPAFNMGPIAYPAPKVFISAVGPAMARVAGRVCDGLRIHGFSTEKYVRDVLLPNVRRGAEQAGRDLAGFEISGGGMLVLGETESEIEQNLEKLRQPISFYGSTRSYHGVFAVHGHESLGMRLHEMSLKNQWAEMPGVIPEQVLRDFALVSTYDNLAETLRTHRDYATRVSLGYRGLEPKDDERLRWLIQQVQQVETPGIAGIPV
jgi:probable F420-dependent oxidoreductase